MIPFEQSEYDARLARVRARMAEAGLDVLVVSNQACMYYLTAYGGNSDYVPQCVVVGMDGAPDIILRTQDMACGRHTVWMSEEHIHDLPERFIGYDDRNGWEHVGTLLETWGFRNGRIGYDGDSLSLRTGLEAKLPGATLVHHGQLVNRVRGVKSDREVEYMRLAGRIADRAMQTAIAAIAPGVRECDVAAALVAAQASGLPEAGGDRALGASMPSGVTTDSPHLSWREETYRVGSAVNIELGGSYRRYVAPLSRTIHIGAPPERLRSLHAATLEGMEAVFAFVRAGVACQEVEARFRETTMPRGFEKRSRIGYAIGIDWAETWASFHPGDTTVLEPNMTFHLMLGMWERDWGLTLSEPFRVTSTGVETFSGLSRELFVKQ